MAPDLILSSPAKRALETAQIIARKLDYKLADIVVDERLYATGADGLLDVLRKLGDIVVDERLYATWADDLLRVIRELGAKPKTVMLFGHNPELTELAHRLSNKIAHLPTCAVAEFTFDAKS